MLFHRIMAESTCKCSNGSGQQRVFSMGPNTLKVPMSLFAENRKKVCDALSAQSCSLKKSIILLQGGEEVSWNDTDVGYIFKQVRNSLLLFFLLIS